MDPTISLVLHDPGRLLRIVVVQGVLTATVLNRVVGVSLTPRGRTIDPNSRVSRDDPVQGSVLRRFLPKIKRVTLTRVASRRDPVLGLLLLLAFPGLRHPLGIQGLGPTVRREAQTNSVLGRAWKRSRGQVKSLGIRPD